jgi:raffinose/stachyose/melibiose transport system substrate-binding protein
MKRILVLLMVATLLSFAFNAWAGGSSEKTSTASGAVTLHCFVHYSEDQEKASFNYAIAAAKKDYPNVTIAVDVMPNDNDEKIKTLAATGDLPDLIDINASLISLFNRSNKLVVLDPYVKETGIQSSFLPNADPMFKDKDGHILSVANSVKHIGMLYYNKKLFADNNVKVPTMYGEFLDAV